MCARHTNYIGDSVVVEISGFAPVLSIMKMSGPDKAVSLANDTEHGLTSSFRVTSLELSFGETYVNRETFEAMQGFRTGVRKSGIGGADGTRGVYLRA